MTPPNEHTSEGGRDDRGVPYHAESTLSSAQVLKTAAVSSMRARIYGRLQNQWSHRRGLLLPTGRCGARQPLFYASRASRRLCFKEGRYGSRSCGTAESTEGGTSPSDMVPYLRMLVVGDIRARSYATGQQSLGDETTDLARRSDTECCSPLRHRRVPRAALNLAEYTSRYHPASRRSGCLICRKTPTSLLLEESFR